jgi:hypothetical protein
VSYDAALMSQAVGRPVRVQLSRKDEMAWENYGFAYVIDQRSRSMRPAPSSRGTTSRGRHRSADVPATTRRATSSPACSPGSSRRRSRREARPAAGRPIQQRRERGAVVRHRLRRRRVRRHGTVKSERVLTHTIRSPFFTGPLRSPSRLQNTFAHESFMDEIAAQRQGGSRRVPLAASARSALIDVVKAPPSGGVGTRPSPRPSPGAVAHGRGIACVLYEGDNGYCALVAEVDVDRASGGIAVKRLVASQDCGPISSPTA